MFPAIFNLSSINGANGLNIIHGTTGYSVSSIGDVNGDEFDDIIMSGQTAESGTLNAYVIFGNKIFYNPLDTNQLNGHNGFVIPLLNVSYPHSAYSCVGKPGDINGDKINDILIGFSSYGYNVLYYVIFGSNNSFPQTFNVSTLDGTNGFTMSGLGYGGLGDEIDGAFTCVNSAGDFNNDGLNDIIVSNPYYDTGAVIYGSNSFPALLNLSSLDGQNGFKIVGYQNNYLGASVSYIGDFNGDHLDDLAIGAPGMNNNAGQSYLIYGSNTPFPAIFNITSLDGTNGFTVSGISASDNSGQPVSYAGDINNDGLSDVIICAMNRNHYSGECYVIFGANNSFSPNFSLSNLNGANGFVMDGGARTGSSAAYAGDVNHDGIDDAIVSALDGGTGLYKPGRVYVIYGNSNFQTPTILLDNLNGQNGFIINDDTNCGWYGLGFAVGSAGDFNGDGIYDMLFSRQDGSLNYVIFGQSSSEEIDQY